MRGSALGSFEMDKVVSPVSLSFTDLAGRNGTEKRGNNRTVIGRKVERESDGRNPMVLEREEIIEYW